MKNIFDKIRTPDKSIKISKKIINTCLIFLLGIMIAMMNFVIRGIILDKSLNAGKRNVFSVISTFIRISTVIIIALFFANNKYHLLLYLAGFITHFPILIFGWIKSQKGSD